MKTKNLLVYSIMVALMAGLVTLLTWQMNGWPVKDFQPLTYITFIAWAGYFLFGASIKGAINAFCSMIAGVVAGILMFVLSIAFGFVPWWAVPLAVFIMVIPIMFCEKVKPINNIAAIFLGTGTFFSLSSAGAFGGVFTFASYSLVGLTMLLYVAIGLVSGWITIQINIFCSKLFADGKK